MAYSIKFKYTQLLIYALVFVIIFIAGGKDLFHNHEFDLIEHEDCPVYIFNTNTQADGVVNYDFDQITIIHTVIELLPVEPQEFELIQYFSLRAPPAFPKNYS